jgi:hypothetical protein
VVDDAIALLFGVRDPWDAPAGLAGLPAIQLEGLPAPKARQLLSAAIPEIDDRVGQRIVAETRGNPLALSSVAKPSSSARNG